MEVKLTNFGLSTTEEECSDMDCGSPPYMSYGVCFSYSFYWIIILNISLQSVGTTMRQRIALGNPMCGHWVSSLSRCKCPILTLSDLAHSDFRKLF